MEAKKGQWDYVERPRRRGRGRRGLARGGDGEVMVTRKGGG